MCVGSFVFYKILISHVLYDIITLNKCISTDIDECAVNVFCEQICNNHPGSYSCACDDDFLLANDQVQCIGI